MIFFKLGRTNIFRERLSFYNELGRPRIVGELASWSHKNKCNCETNPLPTTSCITKPRISPPK